MINPVTLHIILKIVGSFTTVNSKVEAISELLRSAVLVMQSDVFSQNWTPSLCVHLYFTTHELFTRIYIGNFFCSLKYIEVIVFCFNKKSQNLIKQFEHNDPSLITLLHSRSIFQQSEVIKLESLRSSCYIKFKLHKNDDFYLKPKINSFIAQGWDHGK